MEGTIKGFAISYFQEDFKMLFPDWTPQEFGMMRYNRSALVAGGVGVVMWSTTRLDMGIHIRLPSSALDSLHAGDGVSLLRDLWDMGVNFTRLDIALDAYGLDAIDLVELERATLAREYVCAGDKFSIVTSSENSSAGCGKTFYYGSRESSWFMRIYDKAAEQKLSCRWVRAELELHKERAETAVRDILENRETWRDLAASWFLCFIDFKTPGNDDNKSRWFPAMWWRVFLDTGVKKKIVWESKVKTLDSVCEWIDRGVASSLAVVVANKGSGYIWSTIANGLGRLSPRQKLMMPDVTFIPSMQVVNADGEIVEGD